jgi:photosystem II stability/assembly factor-like uncharacterized protein
MSLDNLAVDARGRLVVGFWEVAGKGGGVAVSADAGQHFDFSPGIEGESIRALAVTPAHPDVWVVGAIGGVFRTVDAGARWQRITPSDHPDLRNVESVALDPDRPGVIYAGTWHLPWKTVDAGASWQSVSRGMIDDSDVFTLTVDVRSAERLYATACTGIYSSRDAGASWAKVHGIPSSSRRTRSFAQDPADPEVLYAGTTEGLWSNRGGQGWVRRTGSQMIVNAVLVLGRSVLLGTEGEGVLRSEDGGRSWLPSNRGFSTRHVSRTVFHPSGPLLAGLLAGRYDGGVLIRDGEGSAWRRWGAGLQGRTVLALTPHGEGALVGSDEGIFASERPGAPWERMPILVDGIERRPAVRGVVRHPGGSYLAASDAGLLRSADGGRTWSLGVLGVSRRITALAQAGDATVAATPLGVFRSDDGGGTWQAVPGPPPPGALVRAFHVPRDAPHVVLAVTERGLHRSDDGGIHFRPVGGELPRNDLSGLAVSPDGRRLWVSDFGQGGLYSSADGGESWRREAISGLTTSRIGELALDPRDPGRVFVATAGGGLHAPAASLPGEIEVVKGRTGATAVALPAE